MDLTIVKIPESKYSVKCPYGMNAEGITVHNTANDASAMAEVSYMIGNNKQVSFHEAIDDYRVVQGIPHNRNTWNCGDGGKGFGNRKTISIEICYSKSAGEKFDLAERNAAKRIAQILKEKNWDISKVGKHQDRNGKYCPHKTLDLGWERFLNMIREELGQATVTEYERFVGEVQVAGGLTGKDVDYIAGPVTLAHTVTLSAKKNKNHKMVTAVERYLKSLGYYNGKIEADLGKKPIFGSGMATAVKNYQRDNGCKVDGEITARNKTWKKLLKLA